MKIIIFNVLSADFHVHILLKNYGLIILLTEKLIS